MFKTNIHFLIATFFAIIFFRCSAGSDLIVVTSINRYYVTDSSWATDKYWDGRPGGLVQLLYNTTLHNTWTFSGTSILTTQNQLLDLSGGGQLVVEAGSTLKLSNMRIKGLSGNNVRCMDSASRLIFDQCELIFDQDYSFTVGRLEINHDVNLRGACRFVYQSDNLFSINEHSCLNFSTNMTLSYAPFGGSCQLLECAGSTSLLSLDNAHLYVAQGGLQLTQGELSCWGKCDFSGERQGALILGNTYSTSDMLVTLNGDAAVTVSSGTLMYKNSIPSLWKNQTNPNSLIIENGATLALYTILQCNYGMVQCCENSNIVCRAYAYLNAALNMRGRPNWCNNVEI